MTDEQQLTSQKTSLEVLPSKVTSLGIFDFWKTIREVLLVLPFYLILFFICWWFRYLIKMMVEDILNDNEFFNDIGDTPKEGIE